MPDKETRLVGVLVAATFGYVFIEYLVKRAADFKAWRSEFIAPFLRHPGRRDFLRETLMREEMTTRKVAISDDCGCDDAN